MPIFASMKFRMLSILIFLFSLSQTSSLIISLTNLSKQNISIAADAEETENIENQETEYDSEIQDLFCQTNFKTELLKSKHYFFWKEFAYSVSRSLPEIPPPDCI